MGMYNFVSSEKWLQIKRENSNIFLIELNSNIPIKQFLVPKTRSGDAQLHLIWDSSQKKGNNSKYISSLHI